MKLFTLILPPPPRRQGYGGPSDLSRCFVEASGEVVEVSPVQLSNARKLITKFAAKNVVLTIDPATWLDQVATMQSEQQVLVPGGAADPDDTLSHLRADDFAVVKRWAREIPGVKINRFTPLQSEQRALLQR